MVIIYSHTPLWKTLLVTHFTDEELMHRKNKSSRSHRACVVEEEIESEIQINVP